MSPDDEVEELVLRASTHPAKHVAAEVKENSALRFIVRQEV